MASRKKPKAKASKPGNVILATAVFCDQILEEKPEPPSTAGIVSAIRIFDTITAAIPENMPPEGKPGVMVKCLVLLRTATGPSTSTVHLVWHSPSGKKVRMREHEVEFLGKGLASFQLKINVGLPATDEGDHWFDVVVDGRRLTSMPLRLVVQREKSSPQQKKG